MPIMIDYWYWFVLGLALITIEMLVPTFFTLWIGIAALVTGGVVYYVPDMGWQSQLVLFAILSVISVLAWRQYYAKRSIETDEPLLNRRGEQYIGRIITLQEPITDGQGKIRLDDSTWKIAGQDCPAGTRVKLAKLNNVIFDVEVVE